jgi:DNA-binding winged helix-turn-helix (wHTH) protein/Tfp pilus assembly protein PilF
MTLDHSAPPGLVLDVTAFELRRDGQRVKLQKTPLEILTVLACRPGSLVTRNEIVAAIWGDAVHVDVEAGINTAIRKIRLALDDDPVAPTYIETVVGKGYRFVGPITVIESDTPGAPRASLPAAGTPPQTVSVSARLRVAMLAAAIAGAVLLAGAGVAVKLGHGWPLRTLVNADRGDFRLAEPYVRGRVELARADRRQTPRAYFERALAVDPSYAPAHAGLADFYRAQAIAADEGSEQAWRLAEQYAAEALAVGATSAEAHAAVAQIRLMHNWNWAAAREHAQRALQLNPNLPDAHAVYARYLQVAGDLPGSVDHRKQAVVLDPLRVDLRLELALEQWFAGEAADAVATVRETLTLDANNAVAIGLLCAALGRLHQFDEAIASCSKAVVLVGHRDWAEPLEQEYRQHGYVAATHLIAEKTLEDILAQKQPDLWDLANAYVLVGKNDEALDTLFLGLPTHEPGLLQVRLDPDFDPLRGDPRYAELIRRIGFPSE